MPRRLVGTAPGTSGFPVVSGIALLRHADEAPVKVSGGLRNFQYWHITPRVHDRERVFADRTLLGRAEEPAGRYLLELTRRSLDTRRPRNGVYRLRVIASDICGNRGTLNERLKIGHW